MLALRIILIFIGALMVLSLLGYSLNRDPRWLRFAGRSLKVGVALVVLLMLVFVLERLLIVL
jgi:hypothetical protein